MSMELLENSLQNKASERGILGNEWIASGWRGSECQDASVSMPITRSVVTGKSFCTSAYLS